MTAESLQAFYALATGFAWAGLLASGYQLITQRAPSFTLLERGPRPSTFAAIPFIAFAAPFMIVRSLVRGGLAEGRFQLAMTATVVAGIWSLMSGTVLLMAVSVLHS